MFRVYKKMEELEELVILYPNMRYDIETVMEVVDLWRCPVISIYAIEDFDRDYGKDEKPVGMPHGLEKLQIVLKNKLKQMGAIIDETSEAVIEESSSSDDESGYDVDCWIIKFSIQYLAETDKRRKKGKDPKTISIQFKLTYFYDLDAFGEEWPSMEPINVLIHTNGPLDPITVSMILEENDQNPYDLDVYATKEMIKDHWKSPVEPIDDNTDLCFVGNLGDYLADNLSSESD